MNADSSRGGGHNGAPHALNGEASHYVAMVAHELRSPLLPIINAASLLAQAPGEVDLVQRSARVIERQARIIGRLIEDLMNLSAAQRGQLQLRRAPVAVPDLVRQCLETIAPFAAQLGVRLVVSDPREPMELFADTMRLSQALQNVLFNAVKFSHPDGEVRLRADRAGEEIIITVSDDGIGIDAGDLESIFQLFEQGAAHHYSGGLGIGLYLARQMIEAHGGSLLAASAGAGLGSIFTIRIPCTVPGTMRAGDQIPS
jgi:signal transduction histidine kinase